MSARMTVLGGSAAGVGTGMGCSGYYVERDGTRLVLDLGPNTLLELRKHTDFRMLDGIIISHLHLDHILDLFALRFTLAYTPHRAARRLPLWLPPGGAAMLDRTAQLFDEPVAEATWFSDLFAIEEYDPERYLTVGCATITFTPTIHYVPVWAMRLSGGESGDLVYTADTGPAADLVDFCRDAEVLIAEATLLEPGSEPWELRGHLTPEEAAELANATSAQTMVLTHIWEELDPQRFVDRAAAVYHGRLELARPGLTLTW